MKQIELATLFAIGKNQMYQIENGQISCKIEYLFKISQTLGISLAYLYFGENECSLIQGIIKLCKGKELKELRKTENILRALFN